MPVTASNGASEVAILNRLIRPGAKDLPVSAARAFLKINFDASDTARMRELAQKARDGRLTPAEQDEINGYERVGHLLGLLHSKARRALKARGG